MPDIPTSFTGTLCSHFDWYLKAAPLFHHGAGDSAMWISALDLATGRYPEKPRSAAVGKRCYRWIESPRGSNCYWDQPVFAALEALSSATGNPAYGEAAGAYVQDFLNLCVSAKNGMFLWGNHYYFDVTQSGMVRFPGSAPPVPIDPAQETGEYCETRPLPVDWEIFWRHAPEQTEAAIAAQARGAIVDTATGEFNRHSDGRRGYAFLESGGILVMSLLWLANQTGKDAYRDLAKRVAGYSFSFCDPSTGLMMNAPGSTRWDGISVTSEVGMWARCLQFAARISGNSEFAEMAYFVLERWLEFSWSDSEQQFFGRLRVKDGQPILEEPDTVYQPSRFCDPWHPLFPRHDYPFPCAQACLEAYRATDRKIFRIGAGRWITAMHNSLNADKTRVIYAEHYGRFIHLLQDAAQTLDRPAYRKMALEVAARCLADLCPEGRFRTHAKEWRYDSVDGFGFLALALLKLQEGQWDSRWDWLF